MKNPNERGVTLLELMVALTIFSIATVFLAYTLTSTIRHNFRNSLRDKATTVLNNTINKLRSIDNLTDEKSFDNAECEENICNSIIIYKYGEKGNDNLTFNVTWKVENVNFSSGENENIDFSNRFKKVSVIVKWKKPYTTNDNDSVEAIFYKPVEVK